MAGCTNAAPTGAASKPARSARWPGWRRFLIASHSPQNVKGRKYTGICAYGRIVWRARSWLPGKNP